MASINVTVPDVTCTKCASAAAMVASSISFDGANYVARGLQLPEGWSTVNKVVSGTLVEGWKTLCSTCTDGI